jgi:hypothetical protein
MVSVIFHWFNIPSKKIPIQNDISVKMRFAHPFFAAIFSHCVPFPLPGPPEGRAMNYFGSGLGPESGLYWVSEFVFGHDSVDITCPDPEFELDPDPYQRRPNPPPQKK